MGLSKTVKTKYEGVISEWFLNGFNGAKAYLKYYPSVKVKTAKENFVKLKKHPELQEYIQKLQDRANSIVGVTHEEVLTELQNWLQFDITETIGLSPEEVKKLPIELKRLINKYKVKERNIYNSKGEVVECIKTVELGFVSKEKAMEMVTRHIGFYAIDNKQRQGEINLDDVDEETLLKLLDAQK